MRSLSFSDFSEADLEIVKQLKKKFNEVHSHNLTKIIEQTIIKEFHCSEETRTNPQIGKCLLSKIAANMIDLDHSPDMSREMPGFKSSEVVKDRKKYNSFHLKENYKKFNEKHPKMKIRFSEFAVFSTRMCVARCQWQCVCLH